MIQNEFITLSLEKFWKTLGIPLQGQSVFMIEWALDSLSAYQESFGPYHTKLLTPDEIHQYLQFERYESSQVIKGHRVELTSNHVLTKEYKVNVAEEVNTAGENILIIENGAIVPKTQVVEGVTTEMPITNAEEKAQRRLKDAKKLLEAVEKRFGGNAATKKTQRNLLKRQYENFTASSLYMLDKNFDRLQKLVTDLDTTSIDDLYNNLKVYKPEVKGMSSSSSSTQNMAFVSSSNNNTSNTNGAVNTAHRVSTTSTQVNVAYSINIDNLSNAVICSFFVSQPNSPQVVHEDLEKIHLYDIEEMDLRWQIAMFTIRARRECRALRNQDNKYKESSRRSVPVKTSTTTALVSCDVPPPYTRNVMSPTPDLPFTGLDEFVNKPVVENCKAMSSKEEPKYMTGNMSYLIDYEEMEEGYVAFGGNPQRRKIIGKDHLGKFNGKADEGFFVRYSLNSKGFRVFSGRTRIVEENFNIRFSESTLDVVGNGPDWLFDIDALTRIMNYEPIVTVDPPFSQDPKSLNDDGYKPSSDEGKKVDEEPRKENELADINNLDITIQVRHVPTTRIHNDHPLDQVIEDLQSTTQTRKILKNLEEHGFVRFEDPDCPDRVYKVEKALYGLRQALIAWHKGDILLVKVYVDDIIFGSTKNELCIAFERLIHEKFQMSSRGKLTFFLVLQVKQKEDGIFISQDKYVAEILKKFRFTEVKTASTTMETQKPLLKDEDDEEVDVHMYRLMISSLMYLTSSRPDIMFAVCACVRYQVNPKQLGKGSAIPTDPQHMPTIIQPSSSQPQKTQKPKKPKRKDTQVPQPRGPTKSVADEAVHKEFGDRLVRAATTASSLEAEQDSGNITKTQCKATPNEPSSQGTDLGNTLQSDEDRFKLDELIALCTNLQNRVLDLKRTKTTQQNEIENQQHEIASLKIRVKKLEKKNRPRTHKLKRLYKVGLTARVESTATKKTQKNILKQQYENFTAPSLEMLDQTFVRLQKLVSQLELLGKKLSQEDVNQMLLKSLLLEWNTHAVVWKNKADLDTMSMDDLYNNLKVYEPEVKGIQPNSPQLIHEDLKQIHPDDIKEMDLRWQMTMLTMRARRFLKKTRIKLTINGNETIGFDKSNMDGYNCHKRGHFAREYRAPRNQDNKNKKSLKTSMPVETSPSISLVSCDGLGGYDWNEFVNKPVVENCKAKSSEEEPKVVRKNDDALIIEECMLNNKEKDVSYPQIKKKTVRPSIVKKEFVKSKQQKKTARKTVKQVEHHRQNTHNPRGNQINWNNIMSQKLGSNFVMFNKACYVCGRFDHL
nr:hypothetical protein [Tanacetum cinerariifolium]